MSARLPTKKPRFQVKKRYQFCRIQVELTMNKYHLFHTYHLLSLSTRDDRTGNTVTKYVSNSKNKIV